MPLCTERFSAHLIVCCCFIIYIAQHQREIKIDTWNVRNLFRVGSFKVAARKLARCKLDVVSVRKVRWDKGGTVSAGDYDFSTEKVMKIINWEQFLLYTVE